jgi:hypothetical protein
VWLAGHQIDLTPKSSRSGGLTFTDKHDALVDDLKDHDVEMVMFDSLTRVHRVDENSAQEMSNVFQGLKDIINRSGSTVLFSHHFNKNVQQSSSNRIRGSSDIRAWCDWTVIVDTHKQDEGGLCLNVIHDKARWAEPIDKFRSTLTSVWAGEIQKMGFIFQGEIQKGRPKADAWTWILKQLIDGPMSKSALERLALETDPGFTARTMTGELQNRARTGDLIVTKDPEDKRISIYEIAESVDPEMEQFARAVKDRTQK